jgi:hypothetical protein
MINLKVKHEGKSYKVQAPEDWGEISYSTYLNMINEEDADGLFLASLNLPKEIKHASNLIELYSITEQLGSKVYNTKPNFDYDVQYRSVFIDDDVFFLPKGIVSKSIAQYEDCKYLLKDSFDSDGKVIHDKFNSVLGLIFAIYLQGVKDDKYNYDKAEELLPLVNELPCEQVISVATFFLSKLFKKKRNKLLPFLYPLMMIKGKGLGITI